MKQKKGRKMGYKDGIVICLIVFMIVFPLIARLKIWKLSDALSAILPNVNGYSVDYLIYYKEWCVIIVSAIIILFFIGEHIFPDHIIWETPLFDKKNRVILIAVGVYSLLTIVSTVVSRYRFDLLLGSPSDGEGCFVLIGYMVLMLAGMNYFTDENKRKALEIGALIMTYILSVLGIIELCYKPILELDLVHKLIAPAEYAEAMDTLRSVGSSVSLLSGNGSYFGGLLILLFPIIYGGAFTSIRWKKWMHLVGTALLAMLIIMTRSTGAFYIFVVELLFITVSMVWKYGVQKLWKMLLVGLGIFAVLAGVLYVPSQGKIWRAVQSDVLNPSYVTGKQPFVLNDIVMEGNDLKLVGEQQTLWLHVAMKDSENMELKFMDGEGQPLAIEEQEIDGDEKLIFTDQKYTSCSVMQAGQELVIDLGYPDTIEFYVSEEGFSGIGQGGRAISQVTREQYIGKRWYRLATGRGYVWFNSLPLVARTIILGKGPASFAMYFQQNDYVGLLNTHGTTKTVIDKPHNMYIQTAVQTGGISLLAMLLVFVVAMLRFGSDWLADIKEQRKVDASLQDNVLAYLGVGMIGFMVLGIVNDSIVTVNPIFWLLLGVMLSRYQSEIRGKMHGK